MKLGELSISAEAVACLSNFHSATGAGGSGVQAVLLSHWPDGQGDEVGVVHAPAPLHVVAANSVPFVQRTPGQIVPHAPQLFGSVARFLHVRLQEVWPLAQHRLPVQFPLWHWGPLEQPEPFATWAMQAAPLQYLPLPHALVVGAVHAPAPLQTDELTSELVPLQAAAVQTVVAAG